MVAPCCPRSSVRSWWETEPARIEGRGETSLTFALVKPYFILGKRDEGGKEIKNGKFMDDSEQSRDCRKSQSSSYSYLVCLDYE